MGVQVIRYRKTVFTATTLDKKNTEFHIKDIRSIRTNYVIIKLTYRNWIKTGNFKELEYELTPESLSELINLLEKHKDKVKLSLQSSKVFLEKFPTTRALNEYLESVKNLPKDDVKIIMSK
jgi:hypothetical protein